MRHFSLILFLLSCCISKPYAQKMLLLEETGKLRNTRFYVGQTLHFRLAGRENYWYSRKITNILPDAHSLILGDQLVAVEDIAAIRVKRNGRWKRFAPKLILFGSQLALATALAVADKRWEYAPLFLVSAASTAYGTFILSPKKIKLNGRKRLIATEIRFSDTQELPPPPQN